MNKQNLLIAFLTLFFVIAATGCNGKSKKAEKEPSLQEASVIEVSISGMTCMGCEQTIQTSISKLEGIKSVTASCTSGNAIVEYYPSQVDTLKMKDAVTGSGYTVKKFVTPTPQ